VPLHDVEEECGRSIDVIVHVMNVDGWRHVTEIHTLAGFADTHRP
jgi:pilus assembly protein CpaF